MKRDFADQQRTANERVLTRQVCWRSRATSWCLWRCWAGVGRAPARTWCSPTSPPPTWPSSWPPSPRPWRAASSAPTRSALWRAASSTTRSSSASTCPCTRWSSSACSASSRNSREARPPQRTARGIPILSYACYEIVFKKSVTLCSRL